jgi:hypothetical protein
MSEWATYNVGQVVGRAHRAAPIPSLVVAVEFRIAGMANGSLFGFPEVAPLHHACSHSSPEGGRGAFVGRQGGMKPRVHLREHRPVALHSRPMEFGSWKVHWNQTGAFALAEWPCCAAASLTAFRTGTRRPRETGERAVLMKVGRGEK